ncbi:predicted protein [Sclerotinia sclerotiorum 1980 UF-70]|uniref:Uncharacterized protein n=1 Tax=Sclerotinia sclerotiorum (strain ATCC 18683 / 1980 / Ss-1) TaxID=665079 RepID=A7EL92_SCLS1|nr:predicted protein [Sclerotinia sclerotiorum 1980 UF-70]EDO03608.1 predicted protein [Sclerotinia sclerotiorum 1980 UF-70]
MTIGKNFSFFTCEWYSYNEEKHLSVLNYILATQHRTGYWRICAQFMIYYDIGGK